MNDKNEKKHKAPVPTAPVFSKGQLIASKKYAEYKDPLSVLLSDGKMYTLSETDKILNGFLKGKVN